MYPTDPIPLAYTNNALQAAFINWLLNGTPMPPSAPGVTYPSLASGQLVLNTAAAEGFPTIPGFPFAGDQAWPPFVYDFGPQEDYSNQSGVPTIQPPNITQVLLGPRRRKSTRTATRPRSAEFPRCWARRRSAPMSAGT